MADCKVQNGKLFGGSVILELADGCPDTKPKDTDFKLFMAGTSKGLQFGMNAVTSDADDQGGFQESIVTNADITVPFEGEVRVNDKSDEYGFHKMERYVFAELKARRQPTVWLRMRGRGENVFTAYMVVTSFESSGGTNDIVSASIEFKVAASETVSIDLASTASGGE